MGHSLWMLISWSTQFDLTKDSWLGPPAQGRLTRVALPEWTSFLGMRKQ